MGFGDTSDCREGFFIVCDGFFGFGVPEGGSQQHVSQEAGTRIGACQLLGQVLQHDGGTGVSQIRQCNFTDEIRNLFEEFRVASQDLGQGVQDGVDFPQLRRLVGVFAEFAGPPDDEIIHQIGFPCPLFPEMIGDEAVHASRESGVFSFGDQVAALQSAADLEPFPFQMLRGRFENFGDGFLCQLLQPGPGDGVWWHGGGQSKDRQGAREGLFEVGE